MTITEYKKNPLTRRKVASITMETINSKTIGKSDNGSAVDGNKVPGITGPEAYRRPRATHFI